MASSYGSLKLHHSSLKLRSHLRLLSVWRRLMPDMREDRPKPTERLRASPARPAASLSRSVGRALICKIA